MRWGIYIILLANIGFFVWHFQATDTNGPQQQDINKLSEDGAVHLVMLKEYVEVQDLPGSAPPNWCYSLGPFKKKKHAHQAELELIQQQFPITFRVNKEARKKGYWVFLSPAKDYKEARATSSELKKKHKIKDLFIVKAGEKKHAISLGVFSRFELAYRRQGEIKTLGYTAHVKDVELPTKEYWLDWPREFEQKIPNKVLEMANNAKENVSRIERGCDIK